MDDASDLRRVHRTSQDDAGGSGVKDATDFISHFFGSKTADGEDGGEGA